MAYKLKIGPAQGLKLKGSAGFALPMIGGAGIAAAKAGGIWTVSLDYSEIQSGATVSDDTAYFLTWDSASGIYTRINATDLKAEFEGTFDGYYQPLDATLTALAALDSTAGLLAQTGADTFARRTLTGTANEITVTNGAGTAGNPTVSLPNALTFTGKTVTGGTFSGAAINAAANTISNLATSMFAANVVDNDATLAANSSTRIATQAAVKAYTDQITAANDAMVFKGVIDCSTNPNYPAADRGHTYKVSVAGKIGGASGVIVDVGDTLMCITDGTASGNQATVGSQWNIVQANLVGAVTGPTSSTSGNIATFNGTGGTVIQDSGKVLPSGTIVGTTDTQTLTGKTFDTAGAGNSLSINGVAVTANTGTGAVVRAASPALTGAPTAPTASPSDNSTKIATTAYVDAQVAGGVAGVASYNGRTGAVTATKTDVPLPNYLTGLTLSAAGSTATFGVAVGFATDNANAAMMALASAYTKTASSWAVGSTNGALDTGTIANSTWYHVWLIQRSDTGVVDVLVSTSASAPTMPTNYDRKRRIGSMKTDGAAQWVAFSQFGDEFLWSTTVVDVNAATNPGTAAVTRTLTVPTGVKVFAKINVGCVSTDTGTVDTRVAVSSLDQSDQAPSLQTNGGGLFMVATPGTSALAAHYIVRTNTSGQIRTRNSSSTAGTSITIGTYGWVDDRGKSG